MVAAGKDEIRAWFIKGVTNGYQYMLIVYDRMEIPDEADSAYYAKSAQEARAIWRDLNSDPFCKIMEVYDLTADRESQLAERRAWHLPGHPDSSEAED